MDRFEIIAKPLHWLMALLVTVLVAGCGGGGGQSTILANPDAPSVTAVTPGIDATGVPINIKVISATFNKAMNPATLTTASFTLACAGISVAATTVTYVEASNTNTATLALAAGLTPGLCTATVTSAAKSTTGIPLAANYVWTFTAAGSDATPPTVTLSSPIPGATGTCINKTLITTFSEAMDPLTITNATVTLQDDTAAAPVTGITTYDQLTHIASFKPTINLTNAHNYTATVIGGGTGVKDLAGNALLADKVTTFTAGAGLCATAPALGAAAPFGGFGGGAGMTNQGTLTTITGDIGTTGVSTTMTGFHDSVGDIYTQTTANIGTVTGRIYTAPPAPGGAGVGGTATTFAIAQAAALAAQDTFDNKISPAAMPGGSDPGAGQLGGHTLTPGIYKAAGGTFDLTGSDLTLDGQGDPDSVWVFQTAAALTIGFPGSPRNIVLINQAKAKNVFWYVGSAARIEDLSSMVGTIIAYSGVTISTAGQAATTSLEGRALGLHASVTMVNTIVNLPAP
jgi:hypothetical protein